MIRFFTFAQFHGKDFAGSTNIRVHQLLKYWPEAKLYRYGDNPEVLIFQKVYSNYDYEFPIKFEGIKILDICDPDWFSDNEVARTIRAMDAVTCSTQAMADFCSQLTDKPVIVVPDRWDLEVIPKPKKHRGLAHRVVWFGYRHNAVTLRPALDFILDKGLKLTIIADDDPLIWDYDPRLKDGYEFIRHTDDIYKDLQKADFAVFPTGTRPEDKFKSNNKTTKAILAGLPVAHDIVSLELFMDGKERQKFLDENYAKIRKEYDVKRSVEQMKELIDEIRANRR